MILYHGSNVAITRIDLTKSNRYKDFGPAFYLSADLEQAQVLAGNRSAFLGGEPIINLFEFDESLMHSADLHIRIFPHYSLEWAQFVWNNRDEHQDFRHSFDIVYGPIMNDTIGFQMREYRKSHIDLLGFLEGIKYEKGETFQYAFCTEQAISLLKSISR